ncbi:YbaK/EbsC family protein [Dongia soli]|uniref:YbaK/EbsC family protein n=1 Tax=Dongia soli TaxID=600628 RepID=A0ABU5EEJ8_9PROT|nr:YbaK/EbsC family protein [Dongia soli]MDY0883893.1 YbaK/EbsC family protein [Dongia soli]
MAEGNTTHRSTSGSIARVEQALRNLGLDRPIKHFGASTRTSADAAAAIGCDVAQIAKSLIFRAQTSNQPVLVIASGSNRVDENKIETALHDRIAKADAAFVRDQTGFAIGGVAPVGHTGPVKIFIDRDLQQYDVIWAAAGSPNAVFGVSPSELERITGGQVIDIKP